MKKLNDIKKNFSDQELQLYEIISHGIAARQDIKLAQLHENLNELERKLVNFQEYFSFQPDKEMVSLVLSQYLNCFPKKKIDDYIRRYGIPQ